MAQQLYNRLLNALVTPDVEEVKATIAYTVQRAIADGELAGLDEIQIMDDLCDRYGTLIASWIEVEALRVLLERLNNIERGTAPKRAPLRL